MNGYAPVRIDIAMRNCVAKVLRSTEFQRHRVRYRRQCSVTA